MSNVFSWRTLGLPLAVLAGGCANLSGFESATSSYSCPLPEGSVCKPMSQVYAESIGGGAAVPRPEADAPAVGDAATAAAGAAAMPRPVPVAAAPFTIPGLPAPLLTRPRVLRVYIAPWTDASDTLLEGRRAYLKLDDGRWRLEHFKANERRKFAPVLAPAAATHSTPAPVVSAAGAAQGLPSNPLLPGGEADQRREVEHSQ